LSVRIEVLKPLILNDLTREEPTGMRRNHRDQPSFKEPWLLAEHASELAAIGEMLDENPRAGELVEQDLAAARRRRGRRWSAGGLSGDQVLRCAILKQLNGFSLRELAFHLADSRTYGTFCRLGWAERAPSKSALAAGIKALRAETLEQVHRLLLATAAARRVESGRKVRVDSTVVKSPIHWPSDSGLLWDAVRVLTRLMVRSRSLLAERCPYFAKRLRRAKRRHLAAANAKTRRDRRQDAYRDLLRVAEEVVGWADQVHVALSREATAEAAALAAKLAHLLPLVRQVIDQTRRRALQGEAVPADEKIVSLFEEHTDILRKDGRDTYYGHKVFLTSGSSSLVLDCEILRGNPADASRAVPMIDRQAHLYGRPPRQAVFDGGFASVDNLTTLKARGLTDVAFSKRRGLAVSEMARSAWIYRRLRNFRAGIESTISWLKRVFGLDRCTWRSYASFQSYVWTAIVSHNLLLLARHTLG
jgi:IS5 family transposase